MRSEVTSCPAQWDLFSSDLVLEGSTKREKRRASEMFFPRGDLSHGGLWLLERLAHSHCAPARTRRASRCSHRAGALAIRDCITAKFPLHPIDARTPVLEDNDCTVASLSLSCTLQRKEASLEMTWTWDAFSVRRRKAPPHSTSCRNRDYRFTKLATAKTHCFNTPSRISTRVCNA
jgi:hypothetical protein